MNESEKALTESVLNDVYSERESQHEKWGVQNHSVCEWVTILAEEFGEASKEANEIYFRNKRTIEYREELVQVAAVAVAMIECLDRSHK